MEAVMASASDHGSERLGRSAALLAWTVIYVPVGLVMYWITTFLFAFSGQQYRMVPVVNAGFWLVGLSGLVIVAASLRWRWSDRTRLTTLVAGAVLAWLAMVGIYWSLSFRLGAGAPSPVG
jgi:hypothetical protein